MLFALAGGGCGGGGGVLTGIVVVRTMMTKGMNCGNGDGKN